MVDIQATLAYEALADLLGTYREGRIVDPLAEREAVDSQLAALARRWGERFPGFPHEYFPYTSFRGQWHRGKRDAYLRDIIVQVVGSGAPGVLLNPACVFGRHGRHVARQLPDFHVVATDIEPRWDLWYRRFNRGRTPANYECRGDDIFEPRLKVAPVAVMFFGACGSVTDGAMDYAIRSKARYLFCRTCCHDNIAGNTKVVPQRSFLNRFFRFKNRMLEWMRTRPEFDGQYFSERYSPDAYPRSRAAGALTTSSELIEVATRSPDSDVCRAIIDLDRHLHLQESGFEVWYQGELFVAERAGGRAVSPAAARGSARS